MADKLRWGILSTAAIAQEQLIPAMQAAENAVPYAIASRTAEKAAQVAKEFGIEKSYGSYDELLADPDVDAIYNPLPVSLHAQWSLQAADAGKPVLCEKPLTADAAEARKLIDGFKSRNVLLSEAAMWRYHPLHKKVKEMIDSGAIGDVHLLRSEFLVPLEGTDDIRFRKETAGGAMRDVGFYCVEVFRTMLDNQMPVWVEAEGAFNDQGVEEWLVAHLRFPNNVLATLQCSLRSGFQCDYEIAGSTGRLVSPKGTCVMGEEPAEIHYWHDWDTEVIKMDNIDHYVPMVEDFGQCVLSGKAPAFDIEDSVKTMEIIDRVLESARAKAGIE
jgi:predicted dehydrogenase